MRAILPAPRCCAGERFQTVEHAGLDVNGIAAERVRDDDGRAGLPRHVADVRPMVGDAGQREEEIGEPVEVHQEERRDLGVAREVTRLRSARRQTVRARWSAPRPWPCPPAARMRAAAAAPHRPGRWSARTAHALRGEIGFLERLRHLGGIGRGEMAADGEEIPLYRFEKLIEEIDGRGVARATPMAELSSSTSP